MDAFRCLICLLITAVLMVAGGAGCPNMVRHYTAPMPQVLPPSASLEQVIRVVNRNAAQIQSLSADNVTLTSPGMPTLRASLAVARPKRLRLRAHTGLTGPELDLGSNDEVFWFWIRRNDPPAVYYCRHSDYASMPNGGALPIDPQWMLDSLGLMQLDPALPHQGPFPLSGNRLEVRTIIETPDGPRMKVTIADAIGGLVLEQRIFNSQNHLIARAVAQRHRRDPLTGLTLPRVVDISCPPEQFFMRINLGNTFAINTQTSTNHGLWEMPSYDGYPMIDISNPGQTTLSAWRKSPTASR